MANRINRSLDTITTGKVVEFRGKSRDLRERLARIGQVVSINSTNASVSAIGQIASDSVITPEEKQKLAKEWEHIRAAYNSTVSTVEGLGVSPEEFTSFKNAFSVLQTYMEEILSDMSTSYRSDGRFDIALDAYESAATILQNWINAYNSNLTAGISSYRLAVDYLPVSPTLDDEITFSASIYINGEDKTADLMAIHMDESGLYPDLFIWDISGTDDDSALMESVLGHRSFKVSATDLSGDVIRVSFSASIDVG